jgi:hypothetical protein
MTLTGTLPLMPNSSSTSCGNRTKAPPPGPGSILAVKEYFFTAAIIASIAETFDLICRLQVPSIATWLARTHGINFVGYYLSAAALLTLAGLLSIRETSTTDLAH